jgi:hypothetical protein
MVASPTGASIMSTKSRRDRKGQPNSRTYAIIVVIFVSVIVFTYTMSRRRMPFSTSVVHSLLGKNPKLLHAITWNIAAINNNPFEYWITNKDGNYNRLMSDVSAFIDNPGDNDVLVNQIFTERMFDDLEESMISAGWTGIAETRKKWESEYRDRKIISGFIKDSLLGKKRLASMPDRVTNTINTVSGDVVMRPSVINCYNAGDLSTIDAWWVQWRHFMFKTEITVRKHGAEKTIKVSDMISKIKKSKYPSITAEEEEISIPLQMLCAAIFDAILVDMMNKIGNQVWQPMREDICNKLNRRKNDRTIEILETSYGSADIQFLQEVASSFAETAKTKALSNMFEVHFPSTMDSDRDQNSFILLKKGKFRDVSEVTAEVLQELDSSKQVPIANGDLLAVTCIGAEDGTKYLLASFHGDTNGLATVPIVAAMHKYAISKRPDHILLFGMDANTYYKPESDQQGMVEFADFYRSMKLSSCYGLTPDPKNFTTFHARTHLQPQLNKAVRLEDKDKYGDKNPKDFIVFFASDFTVLETVKDNTGEGKYVENMVFPTLTFPSDHGITSTVLQEQRAYNSENRSENQNNLRSS